MIPPSFLLFLGFGLSTVLSATEVRLATFEIDATPPIGSPLCSGGVEPARLIVTPLTARGIILLGGGDPIVLCAFDWVGISNESHDTMRQMLADAAGTSPERVAVHALHQHDAPGSDLATERLLAQHGLGGKFSNADFDREIMLRLAEAAKQSFKNSAPVTRIGLGRAKVEKVASNRRILGPDGKVVLQRQSSGGKNPAAREAPEGTIDPFVHLISFWNGEVPLVAMTYYATHPQSFYGRGLVNWDLVGMAREDRVEALSGLPHLHFNGAGGNVAAGKYNDGSEANRPILAGRLEEGMRLAWDGQEKFPITSDDIGWEVFPVALPVRDTLVEASLLAKLSDTKLEERDRIRAARDLTFLRRIRAGHLIPLTCLRIGRARVLHFPGELFIEYQLAAQAMRPDLFVMTAAYGDYGPGYIGTKISYEQGGYETGIVSRVAPEVEGVLTKAMEKLLGAGP